MEINESIVEVNSTHLIGESEVLQADFNTEETINLVKSTDNEIDQSINLVKSIQLENSVLKPTDNEIEAPLLPSSLDNPCKNDKEKEKPPSKIVVRRLPPTMTREQFLKQVSPLPEVDYMYYVQGDVNNEFNPFSRAYLNFVNQEDLFSFSRTFDDYVFIDAKGKEYPAIVEFSMYQHIPKQGKKKDKLAGTIEAHPDFIAFKENFLAEELSNPKPGERAIQHYLELKTSAPEVPQTTPLLEFLKERRSMRERIREERREEKERREKEVKPSEEVILPKMKDEFHFDRDHRLTREQVLHPKGDMNTNNRESWDAIMKEELQESRVHEGMSYQKERLKQAERSAKLNNKDLKCPSEKTLDDACPSEKTLDDACQSEKTLDDANEIKENTKPTSEQVKNSDDKSVRGGEKGYENATSNKYHNEELKYNSKKRYNVENNFRRNKRDGTIVYSWSCRKHMDRCTDWRSHMKLNSINNDQEDQETKKADASQSESVHTLKKYRYSWSEKGEPNSQCKHTNSSNISKCEDWRDNSKKTYHFKKNSKHDGNNEFSWRKNGEQDSRPKHMAGYKDSRSDKKKKASENDQQDQVSSYEKEGSHNSDEDLEKEEQLLNTSQQNTSAGESSKGKSKESTACAERRIKNKIVVRKLPPTMTREQFLEQVSPLPEVDYMYYVQGDGNNEFNTYSTAYLNFVNQEDLFSFLRTFDNYAFIDAKGKEYPAILELSMSQQIPKQGKKKDELMGTIEAHPAFIAFKENFPAEESANPKPGERAIQHYLELKPSAPEVPQTTPLLEFLKVRRAEREHIREERREEKERREKAIKPSEKVILPKRKDEFHSDRDHRLTREQVLHPNGERNTNNRESRNERMKEELQESRDHGGKSYQKERLKQAERRAKLNNKDLKCQSEKTLDDACPSEKTLDDACQSEKTLDDACPSEKTLDDACPSEKTLDDACPSVENNFRSNKSHRTIVYSWSCRKHMDRCKNWRSHMKPNSTNNDQEDQETKKADASQSESVHTLRKYRYSWRENGEPNSQFKHTNSSNISKHEDWRDNSKKRYDLKKNSKHDGNNEFSWRKNGEQDSRPKHISVGRTDQSHGKVQSESKMCCSLLESNRSENSTHNNGLMDEVEKICLQNEEIALVSTRQAESRAPLRSGKDISNKNSFPGCENVSSYQREGSDNSDEVKEKEEQVLNTSQENTCAGVSSNGKSKESTACAERRIKNKDRPSIEIYRPGMWRLSMKKE